MVLWCQKCGAFMGVREPLTDWSVDRTGYCAECTPMEFDEKILEDSGIIEKPHDPTNAQQGNAGPNNR